MICLEPSPSSASAHPFVFVVIRPPLHCIVGSRYSVHSFPHPDARGGSASGTAISCDAGASCVLPLECLRVRIPTGRTKGPSTWLTRHRAWRKGAARSMWVSLTRPIWANGLAIAGSCQTRRRSASDSPSPTHSQHLSKRFVAVSKVTTTRYIRYMSGSSMGWRLPVGNLPPSSEKLCSSVCYP